MSFSNSEVGYRLSLIDISKSFGDVVANSSVTFNIKAGEIHGLLGENGAGKSTLMKIIYGILQPDSGQIRIDELPTRITSPKIARSLGISMVFQHFSLFENLTVFENIMLSFDDKIPKDELQRKILSKCEEYELNIDLKSNVCNLSVGQKQQVEIIRSLLIEPKILILDEPTSTLTHHEAKLLFSTLKKLANNDCSIIYISHKLQEIIELCDNVTVIRNGKTTYSCSPKNETTSSLASKMMGEEFTDSIEKNTNIKQTDEQFFAIKNLNIKSDDFVHLKQINLQANKGEIIGIAGIAGNGQNELMAAIAGELHDIKINGEIIFDEQNITNESLISRKRLGICYIPEERLGQATVADMSLSKNTLLSGYGRRNLLKNGLVRDNRIKAYANKVLNNFNVRSGGQKASAKSLSGGNLQKFIIGRELLQKPKLLIAAQPTWGVDAASAQQIHKKLLELSNIGVTIIIASSDIDELFKIADKIAVMHEGYLSQAADINELNKEKIGLLMSGCFDKAETC